jgi:hypothetical protein
MEIEGSLQLTQEPAIGLYPEPDKSNSVSHLNHPT